MGTGVVVEYVREGVLWCLMREPRLGSWVMGALLKKVVE
jgi:hypothetical protein